MDTSKPSAGASAPAPQSTPRQLSRLQKYFRRFMQLIVLVLSVALIVYISFDTFNKIPFLSNHRYMQFQFWVCIVFLIDFIAELVWAPKKSTYFKDRWFFLLISIPYLNIINYWHIEIPNDALYYLRFVPLLRGAYALSMVMGYISQNRAVSLLAQYIAILAALVYILAMIFYYQEYKVNPNVNSFWDALYWATMNMTTVGCYFPAQTPTGKVISVILPISGMLILPVFTVYVTDLVKKHTKNA